ncbi:hypothetical protein F5Y12DRAFT_714865 [Xylaria sp. FL1777]|nr:hypothetical protein F5Y12DRAFT_714865 [Xylaria sp. FL1777]
MSKQEEYFTTPPPTPPRVWSSPTFAWKACVWGLFKYSLMVAVGAQLYVRFVMRGQSRWVPPEHGRPPTGVQLVPAVNETAMMASFWRDYSRIATAYEDSDELFKEADISSRLIEVMFAALSAPTSAEEEKEHKQIDRLIEGRARQIDLARMEWKLFTDTRDRLMYNLINPEQPWRIYLDEDPVDESRAAEISGSWVTMLQKFGGAAPTSFPSPGMPETKTEESMNTTSNGEPVSTSREGFDEQSMAAVALAAHRITTELADMHYEIFKDWDPAITHLREARRIELLFLTELRFLSPRRLVWSSQNSLAVSLVLGRMEILQRSHVNIQKTLDWLGGRFPPEQSEETQDPALWLGSARELLGAWDKLLVATEEGVLMLLRRRDVRSKYRRTYAEASWSDWKDRNCGGTSCYDANGAEQRLIGGTNPTADVAADEVAWIKQIGGDGTPRVSIAKYDEACCAKGTLGHRLKHGSNEPIERQYPEREEADDRFGNYFRWTYRVL